MQLNNCVKSAVIFLLLVFIAPNLASASDENKKIEYYIQMLKDAEPYTGPTDDPPPGPAIAVAEWEPATGVLITYPIQWIIPIELVVEMAEDVEVRSVVADESVMIQALIEYVAAGVDTSNCTFLIAGNATGPYTRDHGPWYIFDGNGEQGIIDNVYTPSGNPDDMVNHQLGDTLGIPVYKTGMRTEGGNYMSDGMGIVMNTQWLHIENRGYSPTALDRQHAQYLGVTNHQTVQVSLPHLHIDTCSKFLDPGRILVIIPNGGDPMIDALASHLETLMSSYGRPYEVIRLQGSGYSNTLFLNNKVLVPQFGDPTDSLALVTWQEAMPGYEVHGYYWPTFNYGDALHCRTHEMHDRYMLRIVHLPIHDRENDGSDYYLEAEIHPYSNEALIGPPVIMWKVDGGVYSPTAMSFAGYDLYHGEIPQQPDDTDIYYYIEAEDVSGRVETHPPIGPGNPHHFHVGPDLETPEVVFNPPATLDITEWPCDIMAYALDNRWIETVTLEYSINGVSHGDIDLELTEPFAVYYSGMTAGTVQAGDVIEMRIKAVDTSVNQNTTYSDYQTITIEGVESFTGGLNLVSTSITPNPFNPTTTISYQLSAFSQVSLSVYNISGRKVAELVDGWRDAGSHEAIFDGSGLASGVYLIQLQTDKQVATSKMVLMK
ncbi:MAG: agmatine deiminase family protein [bacterium]